MAADWAVAVPAGWDACATWLGRVPGAVAARYHHKKAGTGCDDGPAAAAAARHDAVAADDYPDIGEAWLEVHAGPAEPGSICGPDGIGRRPTCRSVDLSGPSPPPSPPDSNCSDSSTTPSAESSPPPPPTTTTTTTSSTATPAHPTPLRHADSGRTRGAPPGRAHVPCPAVLRLFPREAVLGSYPVVMVPREGSPAAVASTGAQQGRLYLTNCRVAFVPSVVNETITASAAAAATTGSSSSPPSDALRHLWDLTFPAIGTVEVRRGHPRLLSVLELHGKAFRHFRVGFPHDDVADTALYTALNHTPAYPICAAADGDDDEDAADPAARSRRTDATPPWSQLFEGPGARREYARMGLVGGENGFRLATVVNAGWELCPSYPRAFVVPSTVTDDDLRAIAKFRSRGRVPATTYRHRKTGATLSRCAQPLVGLVKRARCAEDEHLVAVLGVVGKRTPAASSGDGTTTAALPATAAAAGEDHGRSGMAAAAASGLAAVAAAAGLSAGGGGATAATAGAAAATAGGLVIVDCRSHTAALGNLAAGRGYEFQANYPTATIEFHNIENIHQMREACRRLLDLSKTARDGAWEHQGRAGDARWCSRLESTRWLEHVQMLLRSADSVCRQIHDHGRSVMVHCSDGWDRTPQVTSLAQILLDPYYRTVEGFAVLVEKEWCAFGHRFETRCGHHLRGAGGTAANASSDARRRQLQQMQVQQQNAERRRQRMQADADGRPVRRAASAWEGAGGVPTLGTAPIAASASGVSPAADTRATKGGGSSNGNNRHGAAPGSTRSDFWSQEECSPVFAQFLDCVHQLVVQFPHRFEFNTEFLSALLDHVYDCKSVTFLADSDRERHARRRGWDGRSSVSVWEIMGMPAAVAARGTAAATMATAAAGPSLLNPFYDDTKEEAEEAVLRPDCHARAIRPWSRRYFSDSNETSLTQPCALEAGAAWRVWCECRAKTAELEAERARSAQVSAELERIERKNFELRERIEMLTGARDGRRAAVDDLTGSLLADDEGSTGAEEEDEEEEEAAEAAAAVGGRRLAVTSAANHAGGGDGMVVVTRTKHGHLLTESVTESIRHFDTHHSPRNDPLRCHETIQPAMGRRKNRGSRRRRQTTAFGTTASVKPGGAGGGRGRGAGEGSRAQSRRVSVGAAFQMVSRAAMDWFTAGPKVHGVVGGHRAPPLDFFRTSHPSSSRSRRSSAGLRPSLPSSSSAAAAAAARRGGGTRGGSARRGSRGSHNHRRRSSRLGTVGSDDLDSTLRIQVTDEAHF